jgi:uncharacterized membrane protein YbhN (UPF0104 family)
MIDDIQNRSMTRTLLIEALLSWMSTLLLFFGPLRGEFAKDGPWVHVRLATAVGAVMVTAESVVISECSRNKSSGNPRADIGIATRLMGTVSLA